MAQSLYHKKDGSQSAIENGNSRFTQLINDASIGQLSAILQQTKDPWQIEQISMCKYPSVRADAVASEYISKEALKSSIEYGLMPVLSREGPIDHKDIGVVYSGLSNPILFKAENLRFFNETLEDVLAKKERLFLQAITKNPAATSEYLSRMYESEIGYYELGRKDHDILIGIISHPNAPVSIKIKYASSGGFGFHDEMLRNAAKRSLRESQAEALR